MNDKSIEQLLSSLGIKGASSNGNVIRAYCPFHQGSSGRTFWVGPSDSGGIYWGCWSARCQYHAGGPLEHLLYLSGYSKQSAESLAKSVGHIPIVTPADPRDEELETNHLALWRVDWALAKEVVTALAGDKLKLASAAQGVKLSILLPSFGLQPGTAIHEQWIAAGYILIDRGISPAALAKMNVGIDRKTGDLIFPLVSLDGKLEAIARRRPRPGADYILYGTIYPSSHELYKYKQVRKGHILWGAYEQIDKFSSDTPIVVVEGYADVLKIMSEDFASLGILRDALTAEQQKFLLSLSNPLIFWPDFDIPGIEATKRYLGNFIGDGKVVVSFKKDAAECSGAEIRSLIAAAWPICTYLAALPYLIEKAKEAVAVEDARS